MELGGPEKAVAGAWNVARAQGGEGTVGQRLVGRWQAGGGECAAGAREMRPVGRAAQASAAGAPAMLGRRSGRCQHCMLQHKAKRSVLSTAIAIPKPAARGPANEGNVADVERKNSCDHLKTSEFQVNCTAGEDSAPPVVDA